MKKFLLFALLSTCFSALWGQTTIVSWSFTAFTASADGGLAANIGTLISSSASGGLTYVATCGSGCTVPNPPYVNCSGWNGTSPQPYYQTAAFTTTGYQSLTIVFQSRSSNTGPADFQLQYKVGAGAFTNVPSGTYSNVNNFITQTLALPAATDDQASVQIRWLKVGNTGVTGGTVASTGTSALDEIVITAASTAPIELLSFRALKEGNRSVALFWATAAERNNALFSIERSTDGNRFAEIGQTPGAGTSAEPHDYRFTDHTPAKGINYYRLRQVDFDGMFEYSPVTSATLDQPGEVRLLPMPVPDLLQVQLEEVSATSLNWQVFDYAGRALLASTVGEETAAFEIQVSDLAAGAYVLRIVSGEKTWVKTFQKT